MRKLSLLDYYFKVRTEYDNLLRKYEHAKNMYRRFSRGENQTKDDLNKWCEINDLNKDDVSNVIKHYNENAIPLTLMSKEYIRRIRADECKFYKIQIKEKQKELIKVKHELTNEIGFKKANDNYKVYINENKIYHLEITDKNGNEVTSNSIVKLGEHEGRIFYSMNDCKFKIEWDDGYVRDIDKDFIKSVEVVKNGI